MSLPSRQEGVLGGRYRLAEPIGRGGTSVVWRAHDQVLDRDVAVKVLADGGERFRKRVRLEATAAGRLRNPYIAHVYDYGEFESEGGGTTPYLVMELVDGVPLSSALSDGAVLDWRLAVDIAAQVATALAAAHADGLVHRDVKPDNVLLTDDGVKLIDFGISAAVGSDDTEADGRVLGTVAYVAPERLAGSPVGPAADVYALGVLLYRMIAGVLPWPVADRDGLLDAHLNVAPAALPATGGVPAELSDICGQCLRKDPARRPTSAQLASLLPGLAAQPRTAPAEEPTAEVPVVSSAVTATPGRRRVRRGLVGVAIAATSAVTAWVAASGWGDRDGPARPAAASLPPTVPCVAHFAVSRDWGSGFTATLTVINTGPAVHGWTIAFNFTGGQHLATGTTSTVSVVDASDAHHIATLRQVGVTVIASGPDQTLAPHDSLTLPVTGRYSDTNPIPLDFRLNDRPCATQVAGAAVRPTPTSSASTPSAAGPGRPTTVPKPPPPASTPKPTPTPTPRATTVPEIAAQLDATITSALNAGHIAADTAHDLRDKVKALRGSHDANDASHKAQDMRNHVYDLLDAGKIDQQTADRIATLLQPLIIPKP